MSDDKVRHFYKTKPLTPKEKLFCALYVANAFNAAKSYREAGYTDKESDSRAAQLVKKPRIVAEIDRLKSKTEAKIEIRTDDILAGIQRIAKKRKANDANKLKAYELLGKYKKLWDQPVTPPPNQTNIFNFASLSPAQRQRELEEMAQTLVDIGYRPKTLPNGAESNILENRYHDTIDGEIVDCRASGSVLSRSGNPSLETVRLTDTENGGDGHE